MPVKYEREIELEKDKVSILENDLRLPDLLPGLSEGDNKPSVMKIYLDPFKTNIPDPMLLLIKAAITWSARWD